MNAIRNFWDREVAPFLRAMRNGKYNLGDVQERYNYLELRIIGKYCQPIHVDLHEDLPTDLVSQGFSLPTGARIFNGRPEIGIFVPVLTSIFENMRNTKIDGFRERFETSAVSGFLHEMDHLALGVIGNPQSLDEIIDGETVVWAETCQHTLRLFAEVHGRELAYSEAMYYSGWVACGRNAKSPEWRKHIAVPYSQLQLPDPTGLTTVVYA